MEPSRRAVIVGGSIGLFAAEAVASQAPAAQKAVPDFYGSFEQVRSATIPAAMGILRLTDRDSPIYVRVAGEPPHAGKIRTADRFLPDGRSSEADGGWWELARWQYVSIPMLGGQRWEPPAAFMLGSGRIQRAEGCPDSSAAINALRSLIDARYHRFDLEGVYGVSSTVTIGATELAGVHSRVTIRGNCTILALTGMNTLVRMHNVAGIVWMGSLMVGGGPGNFWAERDVWHGIVFTGHNNNFTITQLYAAGFKGHGIVLDSVKGMNHFMRIGGISGNLCGSGVIEGNPAHKTYFSTTYSGRIDDGGVNSTEQYTRYTLAAPLPAEFSTYGESASVPFCWAMIDGKIYHVRRIAGRTIDLHPWVDASAPASGTAYFVYGAGYAELYSDSGNATIGNIDFSACGIGHLSGALYPSVINKATMQSNCVALTYRSLGNAQLGGQIGVLYCEGNTFDLALFNGGTNRSEILYVGPADVPRIVAPHRHGGGGGSATWANGDGLGFFQIHNLAGYRPRNDRTVSEAAYFDLNASDRDVYTYHSDAPTITVTPPDPELARLFGGGRKIVVVTGTGPRGEPSGTITFAAAKGSIRIEDGPPAASVSLSGMKQALVATVEGGLNGPMTIRFVTRPAAPAIPNGADPTINAILAALRAHGIVSG